MLVTVFLFYFVFMNLKLRFIRMKERMEGEKEMNILTSVWLHPKKTVRYMIENRLLRLAIVLVAVAGFFGAFVPATDPATYGEFDNEVFVMEPMSFVELLFSGLFSAIFTVISMFIVVGFIFLFGKLFKGQGTYWDVFQASALAVIPTLVMGIIGFIWAALNIQSFNDFGASSPITIIYGIVASVLGVWAFVISIGALAEANRYSNWRAFFTLMLPTIIFIIIIVSIVVFVLSLFVIG